MGSHLLGLRDPSQLQELRKSNNMKLPLILAATVAVSLADPHYLRSYGVGPIHHLRSRFGSFGRYGDQAFRSALASQAFRRLELLQQRLTLNPLLPMVVEELRLVNAP